MTQNIQVKRLKKKDWAEFRKLIRLFNTVFETPSGPIPANTYLKKLLSTKSFVCLAVFIEKKLAGGLTAFELPLYYGAGSELLIYDVAVSKEMQRKGLGKKLIAALTDHCRRNKINEFFIPVNVQDKHAIRFYKSSGGRAEKVVHFNYLT
jgi:aminoglycoside 3-N-acetyltransferase I